MKNLILFLTMLLFIVSCSKDDIEDKKPKTTLPEKETPDFFKEFGCKPINPDSISMIRLFVNESTKERYLYGAKQKDGRKSFWVSKFTPSGEYVWEVINKDKTDNTHAFYFNFLSNGDIVTSNVAMIDEMSVRYNKPVIINSKNGSATFVNIDRNYFYSDTHIFDGIFFCTISQTELDKNMNAVDLSTQISNNGKVLMIAEEMNIPEGYAAFDKDYKWFISATKQHIKRMFVLPDKSKEWIFNPNIPESSSFKTEIVLEKDSVLIKYNLLNPDSTITYKLSIETGKQSKKDEEPDESKYVIASIGQEYLAHDELTVILHSIDIHDNKEGTTYYTIDYTLKNKNKDKAINEGIFKIGYQPLSLVQTQNGFFTKLYPGESIGRRYTFKSLSTNKYKYLQYETILGDTKGKRLIWKLIIK